MSNSKKYFSSSLRSRVASLAALCQQYFFFVLVLFIAEIVAIVLYFVYKSSIRDSFVTVWRNELVNKYQSSQTIRETLDNIQSQVTFIESRNQHPKNIGCATYIWQLLESNFIYVIVVAAIILIVEFFAMIFSCVLVSAVKEKRNS
ncbi:hypothetical protein OSTOST_00691 [Ostertagia ostertagi]